MEKIILNTSDEAASLKTITGWVSRHGNFYGDREDAAKFHGCTHVKCDCGNIIEKNHAFCKECENKNHLKRYSKREHKEWDEKTPLYSEECEKMFFEESEIDDYLSDHPEITKNSLLLVICKPIRPPLLIDTDYFYDSVPEGYELDDVCSKKFMDALNKLNDIIEKEEWGWEPGKYRTSIAYLPEPESFHELL